MSGRSAGDAPFNAVAEFRGPLDVRIPPRLHRSPLAQSCSRRVQRISGGRSGFLARVVGAEPGTQRKPFDAHDTRRTMACMEGSIRPPGGDLEYAVMAALWACPDSIDTDSTLRVQGLPDLVLSQV